MIKPLEAMRVTSRLARNEKEQRWQGHERRCRRFRGLADELVLADDDAGGVPKLLDIKML